MTLVLDTVRGFHEIAASDKLFGEVTNIGMKTEISIGDLVKKIAEIMKVEVTVKSEEERIRPDKSEVERLLCDNTKIMTMTDWKPENTLDDGLKLTVEWLKKNLDQYKPDRYDI